MASWTEDHYTDKLHASPDMNSIRQNYFPYGLTAFYSLVLFCILVCTPSPFFVREVFEAG